MDKRKAFEIVYNELVKNSMFTGKYDAINGNEDFMMGICTVMEVIAYEVNQSTYESFSTLWVENVLDSYARAERRKNGH